MADLMNKVKLDLNQNPHKLEQYLILLLNNGLLSGISSIKLPKISDDLLLKFEEHNIIVRL